MSLKLKKLSACMNACIPQIKLNVRQAIHIGGVDRREAYNIAYITKTEKFTVSFD